ncbi:MAG: aminotransferase class V-fold PLP-dependent enzyme [Planctomycetota bacterium]
MSPSGTQLDSEALSRHWALDPTICFLNHGSYGACPKPVLAAQAEWRARLESEPVRFMARELDPALDQARAELAAFVGAEADDLVFVTNATTGVNTVLRSLRLAPGDELLVTDHGYGACRNAAEEVARAAGARVVCVPVPFPLQNAAEVEAAVLAGVSARTRLALLDHVTSPTGLVFPIERLVPALRARGVETLVDGAHALGMLPLNLRGLAPTYYTANAHKWLCTPRGVAFLYVARERQADVRPLVMSHGARGRTDRSRFQLEFGWTGTEDPTGRLCVPAALKFLGGLFPGGWPQLMATNRELALSGRTILCEVLGISAPAPAEMLGALAAVPLPPGPSEPPTAPPWVEALQARLWEPHRIEVPVFPWPKRPSRLLRISAQVYNGVADYRRLAVALRQELAAEPSAVRAR